MGRFPDSPSSSPSSPHFERGHRSIRPVCSPYYSLIPSTFSLPRPFYIYIYIYLPPRFFSSKRRFFLGGEIVFRIAEFGIEEFHEERNNNWKKGILFYTFVPILKNRGEKNGWMLALRIRKRIRVRIGIRFSRQEKKKKKSQNNATRNNRAPLDLTPFIIFYFYFFSPLPPSPRTRGLLIVVIVTRRSAQKYKHKCI